MNSNSLFPPLLQLLRYGCLAIFWTCLASCGGGSLFSSVGSGGSGLAEGAVSGFGSVVVDGVTYDDTNASVLIDNAQGNPDRSQVKLGQRVRISHSQAGVADQIQVLPQLRGTASSLADSNGYFQLLGQWVHIISNSDTQNTATVLDGITAVSVGDPLEVHGAWIFDSTKNVSVLVATRIEKLSSVPDPVLISGVVRARLGNTLTIDNAAATLLQFSTMPTSLAAQSLFTAWVPVSALASSPWQATRVVDASPQISSDQHLVLGAPISSRDLVNGTVSVEGLSVKLPSDLLNNPPSLGSMVQMDIVHDATGWKAISVTQRQSSNDLGGSVSLKGNLVWPQSSSTLTLREVTVTTSAALLQGSCANVHAGDNVYLEITAQRSQAGQPLVATQLSCNLQTPSNAVIERSGKLISVTPDAGGLTGVLVVSTNQGPQSFTWTTLTLLPSSLTPWINSTVDVQYQVINNQNRLRQIKLD